MYAVIKTGGKQYRVSPGDVLRVETIAAEEGAIWSFDTVLMVSDGDDLTVGSPAIEGAVVEAQIRSHGRAKKIEIIKFRRRKHHQKRTGHRQNFTQVQIQNINGEGAPERVATPKTAEVLAALAAGTAAAAVTAKAAPKKKAAAKPAAKKEAPKAKATAEKKPAAKKAAPKKAATKKAKGGDDLTKIEGVGPKAAGALTDAGLATFADVAKSSEAEIKKILDEAEGRFGMMKPATWPKQAKLAADGKWDELKKWQDEMDGGIE